MALNLITRESEELRPRITVFGVGGAGGNAVNNMIEKNLEGAEFVVANTDAQALQQSRSERKLQLGVGTTQGLGAGAKPEIGASAAEESISDIAEHLEGSHMCFITAGMGGGTGTGAAPVIARAAREMGILTVGVVTKPFQFEGTRRMRLADSGIEELQQVVDTLIIIPNQNLFRIANERTTFGEAFMMADDVLYQGVKGVTDLMVRPGLINLDFADVRAVMDEMGKAMMGTGEADGETRAIDAAEKAIANPLLDEVSLKGARGVLINITGGYDLTLFELDEAANRIRQEVDGEANIIVGSTLDPEMEGTMRVSVVATGIDAEAAQAARPASSERRPVTTERIVPAEAPARRVVSAPDATTRPMPKLSVAAATRAEAAPAPAVAMPAAPAPVPSPTPIRSEAPKAAAPTPSRDLFAGSAALAMDMEPEMEAAPAEVPSAFIAPKAVEPGDPVTDEVVVDELAAPSVSAEPRQAENPAHGGDPTPFTVEGMRAARETAEMDKGRFGLNSLIHRMTGGAPAPRPARDAVEPRAKHQAPQADRDDRHEDMGAEDEDLRMEIPAFLRRQAN